MDNPTQTPTSTPPASNAPSEKPAAENTRPSWKGLLMRAVQVGGLLAAAILVADGTDSKERAIFWLTVVNAGLWGLMLILEFTAWRMRR